MREVEGWLLQVYPDEIQGEGLTVWFLREDGARCKFHLDLTVTFYAAGPSSRLRSLWRFLRRQSIPTTLTRETKQELFAGEIDVLAVTVDVAQQKGLFYQALQAFPDLDFYNCDVAPTLWLAARYDVFPLGYCQVTLDAAGKQIFDMGSLDDRWADEYQTPPLRILYLQPECDPAQREPAYIEAEADKPSRLEIEPLSHFLLRFNALLKRFDPDLIVTAHGDSWLFPKLAAYCEAAGISYFNPNRDKCRQSRVQAGMSYQTYGQILHRHAQTYLFGRLHIDAHNLTQIYDSGLTGIFEQARITGMPVQEMACKSPGAGFSAMQVTMALKENVMVPFRKAQAERPKRGSQLIRADQGGLIGQPRLGVHYGVVEFDFISMYPAIITHFNISPETVFPGGDGAAFVPQLGYAVDLTAEGLIPKTLRPLVAKRIRTKARLAGIKSNDSRYETVKRQNNAQKSLQTVAFGYMGHKHFKYTQIEVHESITAYSRHAMLLAKEVLEDAGFEAIHLYVDGIYFKREDQPDEAELKGLLEKIFQVTGLPIGNEGVYKWIIFLPSRLDERASVPNRYFGVFADGELKIRGIEARTRDTPPYIKEAQLAVIQVLADAPFGESLGPHLPGALETLRRYAHKLRAGEVDVASLVITQVLTRELAAYKVSTRVARAAEQLVDAGKTLNKGMRIRYVLTRDEMGVAAWDMPVEPSRQAVDIPRYLDLLLRAGHTVFQAFGIGEKELRDWILHDVVQLPLPYRHRDKGRHYFEKQTISFCPSPLSQEQAPEPNANTPLATGRAAALAR